MPYKVGYAPRGGSQCSVCTNKLSKDKAIPAGDLQFGVFYMNDGQEQLTWRHLSCVNSTQMKNIAKVYPFGKGLLDYDALEEHDQIKIKNLFEHYTGPLNSFEDALRNQGRRYTFAEEEEIQPEPKDPVKSPVDESEVVGASWGETEPRSPSVSSMAAPLSSTPYVAPPKYKYHAAPPNRRASRSSVENGGGSISNQEKDGLTISELGLSLVELDIATARVEHAASGVDVEKAKKKRVEWELERLRRRSETSGFNTPIQEQVEGLELQVIQAELKVAEAQTKLAEARIRKEEAKRGVIASQLAEAGKR